MATGSGRDDKKKRPRRNIGVTIRPHVSATGDTSAVGRLLAATAMAKASRRPGVEVSIANSFGPKSAGGNDESPQASRSNAYVPDPTLSIDLTKSQREALTRTAASQGKELGEFAKQILLDAIISPKRTPRQVLDYWALDVTQSVYARSGEDTLTTARQLRQIAEQRGGEQHDA